MKNSILVAIIGSLAVSGAMATPTPGSLEWAKVYCPLGNDLQSGSILFQAKGASDLQGTMVGKNSKGQLFSNYDFNKPPQQQLVPLPKDPDSPDVVFTPHGGSSYGYQSGNAITCFYSYTKSPSAGGSRTYLLNMRTTG